MASSTITSTIVNEIDEAEQINDTVNSGIWIALIFTVVLWAIIVVYCRFRRNHAPNTETKWSKNNDKNDKNDTTVFITYSKNLNFIIIIFIYILCIFLSFICILYAFGSITNLQITNYWCEKKDLETIYEHSINNNLNEGTNDGCWKSKQFTINLEALRNSKNIYKSYLNNNIWNIIKFIIWFIYSIWFIFLVIIYIYYSIKDLNYIKKKYNIQNNIYNRKLEHSSSNCKHCNCMCFICINYNYFLILFHCLQAFCRFCHPTRIYRSLSF